MKHSIPINSLDFNGTLRFLSDLHVPDNATSVEFDFKNLSTVEPFGMLVASRAISMLRADHGAIPFHAANFDNGAACSYAAHVGFFKTFGAKYGKEQGEASGSSNYIPIHSCAVKELTDESEATGTRVGDQLMTQARSLASVLARSSEGSLHGLLAYSIREVLRNIVEHSQALSYEYCAQYWPSKKKVEVAILDRGIGLRKALGANPFLKLTTDKEAIRWGLLPGISGKTYEGIYIDPHNPYQNSGFGLFLTSQLCRRHGTFVIGSYEALLGLKGNETHPYGFGFRGTAVRLVLQTDNLPSDIESLLRQIIVDGEKMIEEIPHAVKVPNSASKLLRGEFSRGTYSA